YTYASNARPDSRNPHILLFYFSSLCAVSSLSLHDALPIYFYTPGSNTSAIQWIPDYNNTLGVFNLLETPGLKHYTYDPKIVGFRSEEHTSELQSRENLVCRLLLEKKIVAMFITSNLASYTI